ncbi:WD40/YVTN/BNR-like repeat-containing protein [Halarchaeum sp. P4]|uniref:WD40/YVTN/BNR-like repeat-containing protein n=1 Tax=Halarchaeum sp. P4 TaxID=3421639 RepID=UPI003EB6B6BC
MTHTEPEGERPEWEPVDTPFDVDLFDVVQSAHGPYAVGASGTVAAKRTGDWTTVVESGPGAKNRTLRAADATDDGERVWFAGASGAVGAYDVTKGKKYDHSNAGHSVTSSWEAITVTGKTGEEQGYVANGSGAVIPFSVNRAEVTWSDPVEPGGGANITAIATASDGMAYAIDNDGKAYQTKVGAGSWEKIGVLNAQVSFTDIYAGPGGQVYVAAGDGRLYRYDPSAKNWTPVDVANTALKAVDVFQNQVVTIAADNTIYWRNVEKASRWTQAKAPVGSDLLALALGYPDVAVGKAGTVIHRGPMHPPEAESKEKVDPKKKQQGERLLSCEVIVEELLTRLEREELIRLLELRENCDPMLLEHLKTMQEEETLELEELIEGKEVLPLLLAGECEGRERVATRERRERVEDDYVLVPREEVEAVETRAETRTKTRRDCGGEVDIETLLERLRC